MKTTHSKNTTNERHKQRLAFPTSDEEDILNLDRGHQHPTAASIRHNTGSVNIQRMQQTVSYRKFLGRVGIDIRTYEITPL